jgi:hypothetical protein
MKPVIHIHLVFKALRTVTLQDITNITVRTRL